MSAPSQKAKYSDLFLRLMDATLLVDPETLKIVDANPAACEALEGKRDGETLLQSEVVRFVVEAHQGEFERAIRIAMRRYHTRKFETQFILHDGRTMDAEVVTCPLALEEGQELVQLIIRDVTEKKAAESRVTKLLDELKQVNAKLQILSTQDELTGLANVRAFKHAAQQEFVRAKRYRLPFSLIFCDLDHFKFYNDRNGHQAGDQLLKVLADVIRSCCRETDLPARYGGEEFIVLCPQVDAEGAKVLAERIRERVEAHPFIHGKEQPGGKVSLSIGIAAFPDYQTLDQVLEAADQAMYVSKQSGRNRVTAAATKAVAA